MLWLGYWLGTDPKHLLSTPWFWGMVVLAACLAALSVVLWWFVLRGQPDPLASIERRAKIDNGIRRQWK